MVTLEKVTTDAAPRNSRQQFITQTVLVGKPGATRSLVRPRIPALPYCHGGLHVDPGKTNSSTHTARPLAGGWSAMAGEVMTLVRGERVVDAGAHHDGARPMTVSPTH